ncbi:MAG: toxin-activating lysine-acyltransferase [Ferrovibrio sp.]
MAQSKQPAKPAARGGKSDRGAAPQSPVTTHPGADQSAAPKPASAAQAPPGNTPTSAPAASANGAAPATANPPAAAPTSANREGIGFLGEVIWLMMYSAGHKHFFVTDLEWLAVPPVALRQFRLWRRNNLPVAYASWAYLNETAEARLMQGVRKLAPNDWKSGDRLWLVDLVVPFGGTEEVLKELREQVFKDKKAKTLRPSPEGTMVVGEV